MKIAETFGPLIEGGKYNNGHYELRGDEANPILHAYVAVDGRYVGKTTQLGALPLKVALDQLFGELSRRVLSASR